MSYTTLYAVRDNGNVEDYADFRNSHGSAAYVWRVMGERYVGKDAYFNCMVAGEDGMKRIWNLWKDPSVPAHQRAVMASTFDNVMVEADCFERLAADMDAFVADFPPGKYACSLPAQATALRELASDGGSRGACWQQTSVSGSMWFVFEESEGGDGRLYNIDTDTRHWFLYEALDGMAAESAR